MITPSPTRAARRNPAAVTPSDVDRDLTLRPRRHLTTRPASRMTRTPSSSRRPAPPPVDPKAANSRSEYPCPTPQREPPARNPVENRHILSHPQRLMQRQHQDVRAAPESARSAPPTPPPSPTAKAASRPRSGDVPTTTPRRTPAARRPPPRPTRSPPYPSPRTSINTPELDLHPIHPHPGSGPTSNADRAHLRCAERMAQLSQVGRRGKWASASSSSFTARTWWSWVVLRSKPTRQAAR